jgi:hypothetical protein
MARSARIEERLTAILDAKLSRRNVTAGRDGAGGSCRGRRAHALVDVERGLR